MERDNIEAPASASADHPSPRSRATDNPQPATSALIVAADFVKTGGMDRANYALADYLARQGGELHLVGHSAGEGLRAYPNLHWHPVARPLGHDALGWPLLARAGRHWAQRITAAGGRVVVNGGNCAWGDINWVHYVHAAYQAPLAAGGLRRAWHRAKHRQARRDERRGLASARVVIANSERTRRDLQACVGVVPERICVVYYGCDPARFSPAAPAARAAARQSLGWPPQLRTALFLGALGDRRKGFDTLFAAWQQVCAQPGWDTELVVAGRGGELGAWRERIAAASLGERCRFLGFRSDVPQLLAASDLLVSPTRYEAYGLGVHEAFACDLPAIVSADAGVAERVPPELQGLLLRDPDSGDELAARLRHWHDHAPALRPALAALGARLRAYHWDDMAADILACAVRSPEDPA
ncbi:MAG TPA: glycosyltransferase family 4 protein [Terriglobales bacterium]|nr:glycosyltransferase family 4 protein [Terriglobales bacterium]